MSIKCMTRVWDLSKQKGANLLLLLAIADHATDDGFAWPGVETLAQKIRMSLRHTRRLIMDMEATGELYVNREDSHNRYVVTVGVDPEALAKTLRERFRLSPSDAAALSQNICSRGQDVTLTTCHPDNLSGGGGRMCPLGEDIAMSPESSITVSETSDDDDVARARTSASPPDPVLAVLRLYEQEIGGALTAMILDDITDLVTNECQDLERWRAALQASIGARNRWKYAKAIILHPEPKPTAEATRGTNTNHDPRRRPGSRPSGARGVTVPDSAEIDRLNREAEERLRGRAPA